MLVGKYCKYLSTLGRVLFLDIRRKVLFRWAMPTDMPSTVPDRGILANELAMLSNIGDFT